MVPFGHPRRPASTTSSPRRSPTSAHGGDPIKALYVWEGGLGIWGAIALGGVGAWIGCRRRGIPLPPFADALAPGIALAQAVGRFGNYFNQELYGRPTDLPWGLRDRPGPPPGRHGGPGDLPTHVPVRGDLGRRRRRPGHLGRPALPARPRPGVRALRRGLHGRPVLDRGPAHRHGEPLPGAAAQRLDEHRRLRRRGHLLRRLGEAPARPRGRSGKHRARRRSPRPTRRWPREHDSEETRSRCGAARTSASSTSTRTSPAAGCGPRCSAPPTGWCPTSR